MSLTHAVQTAIRLSNFANAFADITTFCVLQVAFIRYNIVDSRAQAEVNKQFVLILKKVHALI